jgi:predicted RNA-binding Zn ribbon-like protein
MYNSTNVLIDGLVKSRDQGEQGNMRGSSDQREAAQTGDTTEFVFVGAALALDFVNTEVVIRGKRRDLLPSLSDVARWWAAAQQSHSHLPIVPFPQHEEHEPVAVLGVVHHLRNTMRAIFSAVAAQQPSGDTDLAALNKILGLSTQALERVDDTQVRVVYQAVPTWHDSMLFSIARSAFDLLTEGDLSRIHHCSNQRCILLFYDTTRSATRHWCSLGCMNRARSAKRYQQTKAHSHGDGADG